MKIKVELYGASKDFSSENFIEIDLKDKLKEYYLPCKSKKYLFNIIDNYEKFFW